MDKIETIRLSEKQKNQLIFLKKKTGIENWNVLCRWALCLSLSDTTLPPKEDIPSDSNVEMTWKTFAGEWEEIYLALLKQAFSQHQNKGISFHLFFKLHLSRGISLLLNIHR